MDIYDKCFERVYIFSPSVHVDQTWVPVKEYHKKEINMISVSNSLKLPFKINYNPLKSLGADRISLAAAAFISYPNLNNIIIDIGTCITVDVFDKKNIFSGGSISPGIEMRYKSLNSITSKLPLLKKSTQKKYPAKTTEDCIHNGVIGGVVSEILMQIEILSSTQDILYGVRIYLAHHHILKKV